MQTYTTCSQARGAAFGLARWTDGSIHALGENAFLREDGTGIAIVGPSESGWTIAELTEDETLERRQVSLMVHADGIERAADDMERSAATWRPETRASRFRAHGPDDLRKSARLLRQESKRIAERRAERAHARLFVAVGFSHARAAVALEWFSFRRRKVAA